MAVLLRGVTPLATMRLRLFGRPALRRSEPKKEKRKRNWEWDEFWYSDDVWRGSKLRDVWKRNPNKALDVGTRISLAAASLPSSPPPHLGEMSSTPTQFSTPPRRANSLNHSDQISPLIHAGAAEQGPSVSAQSASPNYACNTTPTGRQRTESYPAQFAFLLHAEEEALKDDDEQTDVESEAFHAVACTQIMSVRKEIELSKRVELATSSLPSTLPPAITSACDLEVEKLERIMSAGTGGRNLRRALLQGHAAVSDTFPLPSRSRSWA